MIMSMMSMRRMLLILIIFFAVSNFGVIVPLHAFVLQQKHAFVERRRENIFLTKIISSSGIYSYSDDDADDDDTSTVNRIEDDDGNDGNNDTKEVDPPLLFDATFGSQSFRELYSDWLPDWLLDRCEACGWTHPTLIQQRVLKFSKQSKNKINNSMVIQAQTGSGKTLTYLLPILAKLEDRAAIQAMIVVPTRELGLQVARVSKRLLPPNLVVMSLLQGSMLKRQRAWAWAETPQIVIGTPKELLQMIQYGGLPRINSLKYVVVDEVDACLDGTAVSADPSMTSSSLHVLLSKYLSPTHNENIDDGGYGSDYDDVLNNLGPTTRQERRKNSKQRKVSSQRQTLFCSATIPQHRHFLKQCQANQWTLDQPEFISTSSSGQSKLPPTLDHAYLVCQSKDKKLATLRRVLKKILGGGSGNSIEENNNPTTTRKILIFGDPSRPLEEMAMTIAHDSNGAYYQERKQTNFSNDITSSYPVVVSVLRFEDSLSQRAGATNVFADDNGSSRIMLTTDLAARGLDIAGITHVIHFDLPTNAESYLHRSGRTGRLGESGQVLSIITTDQEFVLKRLSNALNLETKCIGRQKRSKRST